MDEETENLITQYSAMKNDELVAVFQEENRQRILIETGITQGNIEEKDKKIFALRYMILSRMK
jgi:hypothetical protein